MHPEVRAVELLEGYSLLLAFDNGERRVFPVEPYLDSGFFRELRDPAYFRPVRAMSGFIAWPNDQDFSPETLYLRSISAAASAQTG